MACAPTGSGKTAAFVIPLLHHLREPSAQGFRAVILAPTRELAKQVHYTVLRWSRCLNFFLFRGILFHHIVWHLAHCRLNLSLAFKACTGAVSACVCVCVCVSVCGFSVFDLHHSV